MEQRGLEPRKYLTKQTGLEPTTARVIKKLSLQSPKEILSKGHFLPTVFFKYPNVFLVYYTKETAVSFKSYPSVCFNTSLLIRLQIRSYRIEGCWSLFFLPNKMHCMRSFVFCFLIHYYRSQEQDMVCKKLFYNDIFCFCFQCNLVYRFSKSPLHSC